MDKTQMTVKAALTILTDGYAQDADFNLRLFVENLQHDGALATMTAKSLRTTYQSWSEMHEGFRSGFRSKKVVS